MGSVWNHGGSVWQVPTCQQLMCPVEFLSSDIRRWRMAHLMLNYLNMRAVLLKKAFLAFSILFERDKTLWRTSEYITGAMKLWCMLGFISHSRGRRHSMQHSGRLSADDSTNGCRAANSDGAFGGSSEDSFVERKVDGFFNEEQDYYEFVKPDGNGIFDIYTNSLLNISLLQSCTVIERYGGRCWREQVETEVRGGNVPDLASFSARPNLSAVRSEPVEFKASPSNSLSFIGPCCVFCVKHKIYGYNQH